MHEVSIALDLLNIATQQCRKSGYSKIEAINLKIGRASGIMPDALIFSFDAIKKDSLADGALLNIEEVPVSGVCRECSSTFTVDEEYVLSCPVCKSSLFNIISGREMDIIDMEVS